jgi:two-component system CheB/CheR fusion protein
VDGRPIRVLLVDDDEDDCLLTRELFAEIPGARYAVDWAATYDAGLEAIGRKAHDIYLLDYRLDGRTGLDLLREALARGCKAPLILQTGAGDAQVDLEAMKAGAADYLVKGRFDAAGLERSIRYALERKRAEEEVRKAREELEDRVAERTASLSEANARLAEGDRRKDEFLATLAHELRNPLAPLRNGLALLRLQRRGDPAVEQVSGMMERQVQLMARLIDDLLDVSRITRGKIELRKGPVDLAAAAAQAVEAARPLIEERGHRLEVALPPAPVRLEADAARLEQVLSNLLNNAAKYTEPGGRIALTAERHGGEVVIRVKDSGIGIRPEMLPRVFDLFQQADRVEGRVSEGLGIGLTLVRRLVELHGGRVTAHSQGPGRGSEFVVRLPLPAEAPRAGAGRAARGPVKAPGRRVLVVEDNPDAAESLALLLRAAGHEVRVAADGPAALEAAAAFRPQVVLLDIGLPKMDGYEVARRLRRGAGRDGLLLVALSGYGQEEDRRRSRAAGFDAHLVKPADLDALQELLAELPGR